MKTDTRKLRDNCWKELMEKHNGNYDEAMEELNELEEQK